MHLFLLSKKKKKKETKKRSLFPVDNCKVKQCYDKSSQQTKNQYFSVRYSFLRYWTTWYWLFDCIGKNRCTVEIRRLSVLAFTKYCTGTPLAHSLFPKMKVDFKKQNVCTFENFTSPRDSPRLIFCVLWRNYAYRTQDACLKKSLLIIKIVPLSELRVPVW